MKDAKNHGKRGNGKGPVIFITIGLIIGLLLGVFTTLIAQQLLEEKDTGEGPEQTADPYSVSIVPGNFVKSINNTYLPLTPGKKYIYEGTSDGEVQHIEVATTNDTKVIMGVTCNVVRDTVYAKGKMVEDTLDWYAQDKTGKVWYMGEDAKGYKDGQVVSTKGSWTGGVDGALPGIVMFDNPLSGMTYRQEYYKDKAEDMSSVITISTTETVKYGTFDHVLRSKDYSPLEPGVVEYKYYAPGVGEILSTNENGGERMELISIVTI